MSRPVGASQRDAYRPKIHLGYATTLVAVWVLGRDGKVFSAAVPAAFLGIDEITMGQYQGLVWWPLSYI